MALTKFKHTQNPQTSNLDLCDRCINLSLFAFLPVLSNVWLLTAHYSLESSKLLVSNLLAMNFYLSHNIAENHVICLLPISLKWLTSYPMLFLRIIQLACFQFKTRATGLSIHLNLRFLPFLRNDWLLIPLFVLIIQIACF